MASLVVPPHPGEYLLFSSDSFLHTPAVLPLPPRGDSPTVIILIRSTLRTINWSPSRTITSLDVTSEQRISMHEASDFIQEYFTARRIINDALLGTFVARNNMPPIHRHKLVCEFTDYIRSTIFPFIMNMQVNLPGVFYEVEITNMQHVLKYPTDDHDQRRGSEEQQVRAQRVEAHDQDCPVCFGELVPERDAWMPCHHRFHPKCIVKWLADNDSFDLSFSITIIKPAFAYLFHNS